MKTVKILGGGYSYIRNGRSAVAYRGERVSVEDAEAVRLSTLRVAEMIGEDTGATPATVPPVADSSVDSGDGGGPGIDPPRETPPLEDPENGGKGLSCRDLPSSTETLDIVDGHFTKESLMGMTRTNLEKLAEDLGVNVSKCKNKTEIATLLAAVEVGEPPEADTEAPPDLGAEAPVV